MNQLIDVQQYGLPIFPLKNFDDKNSVKINFIDDGITLIDKISIARFLKID